MKTIKNLFLLLTAIFFITSCDEREYDVPPINYQQFTGKANITIKDFLEKYKNVTDTMLVTQKDTIEGYVTSTDISGNIFKQLVIQDETAALVIDINQSNMYTDYPLGQKVIVECDSFYVGKTYNMFQMGGFYKSGNYNQVGRIEWLIAKGKIHKSEKPDPTVIKPDTITVDNFSELSKEENVGKLYFLKGVVFQDGGQKIFATDIESSTSGGSTDRVVYFNGNSTYTVTTRNSTYADFATNTVPTGTGNLVGILTHYNGSPQFLLRTYSDVQDFSDVGSGTQSSPWNVKYALDNQTAELQGWVQGYIVGAVKAGVTTISSNSDIDWVAPFEMDNTVLIAADASEKDYSKCLVVNLPAGVMRSDVNLKDNADNLGKLLKVNGKLQSYMGTAGLVTNGAATDYVFEKQSQAGDGTKDSPYTVGQGKANQGDAGNNNFKWITGYVVGIWEGSDANGNDLYPNNFAKFDPPFYTNVNLLLASTPGETSAANCLNVQLPASMRDVLSPMNNAAILKQLVKIQGSLEKYNGMDGVKNLQDYEVDGSTPPQPPTPSGVIFLETCGNDGQNSGTVAPGDYTGWDNIATATYSGNVAIRKTNALDTHVWFAAWSTQFPEYKYLTISGINTAGCTGMTLSFDAAHNGSGQTVQANLMQVSVKDLNTGTETALTVPATVLGYNSFVTVSNITGIPATSNLQITFSTTDTNTMGMRLDNIRIDGTKP